MLLFISNMTRDQFIRLKKGIIIFNTIEDKMVIVQSSFLDPSKVEDKDELICLEFFMQKKEVKIQTSEYDNWKQFRMDSFMDDLSQGLINKLLLKKIMIIESKLKNVTSALI